MGRRREARACFAETLRLTRTVREFTYGVIGYLSALTSIDFLEPTYVVRHAFGRMVLRASMMYGRNAPR
jgi:hypothetical protein